MTAAIKDVAKAAGVSMATVSRVLNNIDVVTGVTKKKVFEAIEKLAYRPNIIARSLKTRKTTTIGVVLPDISSQFYPEIVRGAEDIANIYKYNIILCNTDNDSEKEMEYLNVLNEKMIDGVLYMGSSFEKNTIELNKSLQIPMVLIDTADSTHSLPSVTIDNERAAYDAVQYLINNKNKRIAYIGTQEKESDAGALRYKGYKRALQHNGIELDISIVNFGGIKAKDGVNGMNNILKTSKIDAVFCSSDEIAMGAINALRENNISVPKDVDVMGFNNIYSASIFYPKLTTVSQPMYDMGSVGMRMLIDIIDKIPLETSDYILEHKIIERDSCKINSKYPYPKLIIV